MKDEPSENGRANQYASDMIETFQFYVGDRNKYSENRAFDNQRWILFDFFGKENTRTI